MGVPRHGTASLHVVFILQPVNMHLQASSAMFSPSRPKPILGLDLSDDSRGAVCGVAHSTR